MRGPRAGNGRPMSMCNSRKRPFGPQNGAPEAASGAKPVHVEMMFTRQMTQKHRKMADGVLVVQSTSRMHLPSSSITK